MRSIPPLPDGHKTGTVNIMKIVAAIHDLSCHSKSSLTVVIPTLAAMGVQASILPTALLSTQTDGYVAYEYLDVTDFMSATIRHWKLLKLQFDALYSGFLGSEAQIDIVLDVIDWQKETNPDMLVVIDPVLGDHGLPYSPVSDSLIKRMGDLVARANCITPNTTEAALLLKEPFKINLSIEEAMQWAQRLSALGPEHVAITSVMDGLEGVVVAYDATTKTFVTNRQVYAPISYPGCGDLFASIVSGQMVQGFKFVDAVEHASRLVSQAVHLSYQAEVQPRLGVAVELIMPALVESFR